MTFDEATIKAATEWRKRFKALKRKGPGADEDTYDRKLTELLEELPKIFWSDS